MIGRFAILLLVASLSTAANASGQCTVSVQCLNGSASCSANAGKYGDPRNNISVACGLKNANDKFLSCWGKGEGKDIIEGIICCDRNGNAIQIDHDNTAESVNCQSIK